MGGFEGSIGVAVSLGAISPQKRRHGAPLKVNPCGESSVTDPAAPPLRPERQVPNSIATMRRRLTVALAQRLSSIDATTLAAPKVMTQRFRPRRFGPDRGFMPA
jgi:hypothetical protein